MAVSYGEGNTIFISTGVGPRGPKGDTGATGPQGAPGEVTLADFAQYEQEVRAVSSAFRVSSLTDTKIAGNAVIEAVGIPEYVSDVTPYADFGITDTGWYVFARIAAPEGTTVTAGTTVTGAAGHIAEAGADHVDVAVGFEVAAMAKTVVVNWGESMDTFVFRATDLAIRNLDYRTTFYVYDIAEFVTWEFGLTGDATFAEGKTYYVQDGDEYEVATVTAGDAVPAVYYEHDYVLTEDEMFVEGTTYYTESEGTYTAAEVTPGDAVTPDTYYVDQYAITEDTEFADGKTYYTKSGTTYSEAVVTAGEDVPTKYYVHTKVKFEGMTRNVTYRLDEAIDCPAEITLPEIEDDGYGAWYEIQTRVLAEYSLTLNKPEGVKVAQNGIVQFGAGVIVLDLQYADVDDVKIWRAFETQSTFTANTPALVSIAFRKPPTTVSYTAGDTLDLTGAEVVATYADGHTKLVTASCTFTPASGATLATTDTELVASLTVGDVTATDSVALTVGEGA